ncbi:MAG: zinc-binding dehydrogenase [Clostridia bacterium]|nr:zinc-binding dehydrogenase [Clostridia bacterium]
MKGWKIVKPFSLKECEISDNTENNSLYKIKITKALVSLSDVLRYTGEINAENVVLGSYGIGIVSETQTNLFGLEKGSHVYVESYKPCMNCYNCLSGEPDKCSELLTAGEDYDGFLSDFVEVNPEKVFLLPESVSDFDALFIGHISLALSIVDKLGVQKGDYVAIVGTNNCSNILAQLLIYYQAVPIVLGFDKAEIEAAKSAGIYYVLDQDSNWQKEISSITGGRMTKSVVYFSDSNIPVARAFSVASYGASVVFTGVSYKNNPISFSQAIKKQLNIYCINESAGNTAASINLLANKAVNLSYLRVDVNKYEKVPDLFKKLAETLENDGDITETIVETPYN